MSMSLLKAGLDLSNNEKDFITAAIKADFRQDGRKAMQTRPLRITYGRSEGQASAEIQLGKTKVLSVVTAEVVPPYPDRPTEGFLNFSVEFSPMASISAESSRSSPLIVEIDRIIERSVRESHAIDVEALCIIAGVKVWSLRVDIHILDDVGNTIDAAALATMAALQHFRLAEVTVTDESTVVLHHSFEKEPVPLPIHHVPICISFALYQEGKLAALDPTDREEIIMEGRISFSLNVHKELCAVHKIGGAPLTPDVMMKWIGIAVTKVTEWSTVLSESLAKADERAKEDRLRKIRGTTSMDRNAALLGLAPSVPAPESAGADVADISDKQLHHLDYAELHVPIKVKENGPPQQPQVETDQWRMLEKAAEEAEKYREQGGASGSAMEVEGEAAVTGSRTGALPVKKTIAPSGITAPQGKKADEGGRRPASGGGSSKKGKKEAVEMEIGSEDSEEEAVTLPGSEFGSTQAGVAAVPPPTAPQSARGKTRPRPAPVSDAWDEEDEGQQVDDLRAAVKKPASGKGNTGTKAK